MKAASLLPVVIAFAAGWIYGDERRRRQYAEGYALDVTRLLRKHSAEISPLDLDFEPS